MPIATDGQGNYLTLGQDGQWTPAQRAKNPETGTEMVNDGGTWKPLPGSEPSTVGSALRGAVKGITFGFGDELRGGTDALAQGIGNLIHGSEGRPTMGQAYDQSVAASREQNRIDAATNPVSNVAGQVAGAVAPMVVAAPAAAAVGAGRLVSGAAGLFGPLVSKINPMMSAIPGWLQTGAGIAGGGAAAGGVAGFGEGEGGVGSRLEDAAVGAGTGALVAPAIKGIATAAPAAIGRVFHSLGWRDAPTAADRQIIRSLDRGGVSVDDAATRMAAAGDNPTALVDVGGRNTINLGATAANTPGTSMQAADDFVQARRAGRPDRLMTAGDEAFGGGSGTDIAEATAGRRAQRSSEAPPLYDEAFGKPAGMTDRMQHIIDEPIGQTGLRQGLEIQRIENNTRRARGEAEVPTHDPAIRYDEDGTPRIVGVPNMRTLDAIKRGMDQIVETYRDKTTGVLHLDERGRAVNNMNRTWVGLLDENNPAYAQARAAWGGPTAQMEATQAGKAAFRTDRDRVAEAMDPSRPPDVRDAYRLGAGRNFSDKVSDPASASGAARDFLEDDTMQRRLGSILSPEERTALNETLRREVDYTDVERNVGPRAGSQTHRLGAGGEDMGIDPSGPAMQAIRLALSGHPFQGAIQGGQNMFVRRFGQGMTPATADALANRLFVTNPDARQRVTDALRNRLLMDEQRRAQIGQYVRPAVRALSQTAGGRAAEFNN